MDNQAMKQKIEEVYSSGDMQDFARAQDEMAADDIVQEWPQSGERIRGKDNIRAVNMNYPTGSGTSPTAKLRRVLMPGEAWVMSGASSGSSRWRRSRYRSVDRRLPYAASRRRRKTCIPKALSPRRRTGPKNASASLRLMT